MEIPSPLVNSGLSALWDNCSQNVYFADFLATGQAPSIFRYDYNEKQVYSAYIDGAQTPIFIIPVNDCKKYTNLYAVGTGHDVKIVSWQKGSNVAYIQRTLFTLEKDSPISQMAIGRPGPNGRLYVGTFTTGFCTGPNNSSFYMYTKSKGVQRLFGDVQSTNGVAVDRKRKKLYHLETCKQLLTQFDWDPKTGDICK